MKKDVLYFVAKASFEGTLEEERDLIREKMTKDQNQHSVAASTKKEKS